MLRCLHITDFAIVREATLDLGPGLTLLTGETGAGKSILVDALAVVFGGRTSGEMVRSGAARASVEALLDLERHPDAAAFLEGRGFALDGDTVVARREILPQGRSRGFIGGTLAASGDLKALGTLVADLHGQHEQQTLLDPARHRALLDRHARLGDRLESMQRAAADLEAAGARLASMRDGAQRVAQRIDLLRFQVDEIDRFAPRPGERAQLRAERDLLRHAETVLTTTRAAYEALYEGDAPALGRLAEALRAARDLVRFDPGLEDVVGRAEAARVEIEELARVLRDFPSRLDFEPGRLEVIDDRLAALEDLLRKHAPGGDDAVLLARREAAAAELAELTGGGASVADLESRVEALGAAALRQAGELSGLRRAAAAALERRVVEVLEDLGMKRTRFSVDFRLRQKAGGGLWVDGDEVAVDATGYDVVEFLLSANPGEPAAPLAAVASGGELSRIMLALEVALRRDQGRRLLVFDEIDAGVGGAAAAAVGRTLQDVARVHQVVCVTHLPQIASCADRHVRVRKRTVSGRTEVVLEDLDEGGKVRELARMLAGAEVTPAALRHAAELRARGEGAPSPGSRG